MIIPICRLKRSVLGKIGIFFPSSTLLWWAFIISLSPPTDDKMATSKTVLDRKKELFLQRQTIGATNHMLKILLDGCCYQKWEHNKFVSTPENRSTLGEKTALYKMQAAAHKTPAMLFNRHFVQLCFLVNFQRRCSI